jgi:peptide/nickel transport system permease protein
MTRFIIRRLIFIPIALLIVNFLGFSYAHFAKPLRSAQTPFRSAEEAEPLLPAYREYLSNLFNLSLTDEVAIPGDSRSAPVAMGEIIRSAAIASAGLLLVTLVISTIAGFFLGILAVKNQPPTVRRWLTAISTIGLSMPSFYIGSLLIFGIVFYLIRRGPGTTLPIPLGGFGWDMHLLLPTIALTIRPTVQLAQSTAGLLTGELDKQYVIAARSLGHTWRNIRTRYAMRNILAPVFLMLASMVRLIVGEMVIIEWLFRWPGLGRLLAWTLVPPELSSQSGSPLFLNPPVMATTLTIIAALFLISDFIAAILVRMIDPPRAQP